MLGAMTSGVVSPTWWQHEAASWLPALDHLNEARRAEHEVNRCESLCKALNKTWNALFKYRKKYALLTKTEMETAHSDSQAITQLFMHGLAEADADAFCGSTVVRRLVEWTPRIMNQKVLGQLDYDPRNLGEDIRRKAEKDHERLVRAAQEHAANPGDRNARDCLLKRLAQVVYIVRSNIAHGEKTPYGPDGAKGERDRSVSTVMSEVLAEFFDLLLDRPSRRLAVYGSLAPGQPNASVLGNIAGTWSSGMLKGAIEERVGLRYFRWDFAGNDVAVEVLTSGDLSDHFERIDNFEGRGYLRTLIPVTVGSALQVANVYEAARD
ncbi:hypothetical protein [Gemmatimonas sp.]|uniref:hypothetical protein n=1 Tax=Gemmatimonas sp. TaxID=1962908 RepID=UPI00398319A3